MKKSWTFLDNARSLHLPPSRKSSAIAYSPRFWYGICICNFLSSFFLVTECRRLRDICVGPYKETITSLSGDQENRGGGDKRRLGDGGKSANRKSGNQPTTDLAVRRSPRKSANNTAASKITAGMPRSAVTGAPAASGGRRQLLMSSGGASKPPSANSTSG